MKNEYNFINYSISGFILTYKSMNSYRVMSYYILLTPQMHYDITGQIISPDEWFKMRLTDYNTTKDKFSNANNILVKKLGLNNGFLIG